MRLDAFTCQWRSQAALVGAEAREEPCSREGAPRSCGKGRGIDTPVGDECWSKGSLFPKSRCQESGHPVASRPGAERPSRKTAREGACLSSNASGTLTAFRRGRALEHSKEKRSRSEVISAFLTSWALRLLGTPPRVSVWSGDSGCSDVSVDSMVPTAEGALVAGNFDWLGRQTAGDSGGFDKRSAAVQATVRQRCSTAIHALEGKALHQQAFQWSGAEI